MTFLEIFLLANAFILGGVVTLAIQYGVAHKKGKKTGPASDKVSPVPAAVRERIAKQAEENFQGIVNRSALQLQHDLGKTGETLGKQLDKFGSEVLEDEMKLFRANVSDLRTATQAALSGAQSEITAKQSELLASMAKREVEIAEAVEARRAELEAELEAAIAAEKEAVTERLNTKLNDAVIAFVLESLGHEVDLGAQADYLVATLDANKAELIESMIGASAKKASK